MGNITFKILGKEIEISTELDRYNSVRKEFLEMAAKYTKEFEKDYKTNISSLSALVDKVDKVSGRLFHKAADDVALMLMNQGIFTYDGDSIAEKYMDTSDYDDKVSFLQYQYDCIEGREADLDEMRRARRISHQNYVGGGFGISGALKGRAAAGMLNMGAGIIHGSANMVGKFFSTIQANRDKDKIFHSYSTLSGLTEGVFEAIYSLENAYIEILSNEKQISFRFVTESEADKAASILNNLSKIEWVPDVIPIAINALELNPYSADAYYIILRNCGNPNNEVKALADYFGINYDNIADQIMNDKFGQECKILSIPQDASDSSSAELADDCSDNEEKIKELRQKIIDEMNRLEIDCSSMIENIDIVLEAIEKAACTYKKVEYPSRDECLLAERQDKELEQFIKDNKRPGTEELISLRSAVVGKGFLPHITKPYLDSINHAISKEIISHIPETCTSAAPIEKAQEVLDVLKAVQKEAEGAQLPDNELEYCMKKINSIREYAEEIFNNIKSKNASSELADLVMTIDSSDIRVLNRIKDKINKTAVDKEMRKQYTSLADYNYTVVYCSGVGFLTQEKADEIVNELVSRQVEKSTVLSVVDCLIATDLRECIEKVIRYSDKTEDPKCLFRNDISPKQMTGAVEKLAPGVRPNDVIMLIDDSVFSNGRSGMLYTTDSVYITYTLGQRVVIRYEDVDKAIKYWATVDVFLNNGREIEISEGSDLAQKLLAELLPRLSCKVKAIRKCVPDAFKETNRIENLSNSDNETVSSATQNKSKVQFGILGSFANISEEMKQKLAEQQVITEQTSGVNKSEDGNIHMTIPEKPVDKENQTELVKTNEVDLSKQNVDTQNVDPAKVILSVLKLYLAPLGKNSYKAYISPDIPQKQEKGAVSTFAKGIQSGNILGLLDTTLFGSGKKGVLFTEDTVFLARTFESPIVAKYHTIESLKLYPEQSKMTGGLVKFTFIDGTTVDFTEAEVDSHTLIEMLSMICSEIGNEKFIL